jgi:L-2-hydroxyglutarate oxidase
MQYDVIIAGAGIVGLATGLKILEKKPDAKLLIIEKEAGIARHQTGHNSGVIHSGIYYKPGSLKAMNCISGYKQLLEFCDKENVPYNICGKVIAATDDSEIPYLETLYERGIANGLINISKINKEELKEFEPHANGISGIHVPYTGIIDYTKVSEKYAEKITSAGGEIALSEKVIGLNNTGNEIEVDTDKKTYTSKKFVNCCGLFSDRVQSQKKMASDVRIIPFRGEYYKIKEDKQYLVNNLIYPVPNPDFPFLGVHFTRMINGGVEAGPNAVLAFKLEGYKKTSFNLFDAIRIFSWPGFRKVAVKYYKVGFGEFKRSFNKKAFVKALQKLLPEIQEDDLITGGSGVRAQAVGRDGKLIDDFVIRQNGNIINVLNAPSPAATSSLAIGDTISEYAIKY